MINALWRFILTLIFIISLGLVLAIVWEVPKYVGYELPGDFSKLPTTLLILLALVTGVWGTWTRGVPKNRDNIEKATHTTHGDIFATPNSDLRHEDLSMVEAANQTSPTK